MKEINIIVATSTNYGIGYNNKMCWNIPEELANFRKITTDCANKNKKNCVVMGKNTWFSLPNGALNNRINIIITSEDKSNFTNDNTNNIIIFSNLDDCFKYIYQEDIIEKAFIIGGAQLYNTILDKYLKYISKIYMSIIYDKEHLCDKFINHRIIYERFHFYKENIHFTEKYVYMIGYNKEKLLPQNLIIDEDAD